MMTKQEFEAYILGKSFKIMGKHYHFKPQYRVQVTSNLEPVDGFYSIIEQGGKLKIELVFQEDGKKVREYLTLNFSLTPDEG